MTASCGRPLPGVLVVGLNLKDRQGDAYLGSGLESESEHSDSMPVRREGVWRSVEPIVAGQPPSPFPWVLVVSGALSLSPPGELQQLWSGLVVRIAMRPVAHVQRSREAVRSHPLQQLHRNKTR